MYVYIDVVKGDGFASIYLLGEEVAYIGDDGSNNVIIEDYANNNKFVIKNGDLETCISRATNAYKGYYEAFGLYVDVVQSTEKY